MKPCIDGCQIMLIVNGDRWAAGSRIIYSHHISKEAKTREKRKKDKKKGKREKGNGQREKKGNKEKRLCVSGSSVDLSGISRHHEFFLPRRPFKTLRPLRLSGLIGCNRSQPYALSAPHYYLVGICWSFNRGPGSWHLASRNAAGDTAGNDAASRQMKRAEFLRSRLPKPSPSCTTVQRHPNCHAQCAVRMMMHDAY